MVDGTCPICQTPLVAGQDPCPSCGAGRGPGTLTRHLPAGHALQHGRFTTGRVLGEGGFGITYKGAHRVLGHLVAIKEYFPAHAQRVGTAVSVPASQQAAFIREREGLLKEAQVLFGLRDPSIVQVYDAFQENGTAYIVMEYLEGRTLEARIRQEGRIPADEVQRLAQALGQALEAVHAQHLLHRDIKPANVMLTPEGRSVLIDFGSARAFQRDLTQRHTRIVTPGYAAPEQYSEEARFGLYTDIFGLGATLYHALTGAPPPSAIDRLQSGRAPSFPADLPTPLADAVRQALALRVADRPSSVAMFLDLMQKTPSTARTKPDIPAVASASRVGTKPARKTPPVPASNSDREVLVALYRATNGSQWLHQTGWLSDARLDNWFGVYTTKFRPRSPLLCVSALENNPLSDRSSSRRIPGTPGEQVLMADLNMPIDNIRRLTSGHIPGAQVLTSLAAHAAAHTHRIKLTAVIERIEQALASGAFPGLKTLVGLDLSHNRLSGSIPPELGRLTRLQYLDLSHNRLSGSIPPELGRLTRLQYLDLSHNRLSGSIPPELGRLTRLQYLNLSHNQLSGSITPSRISPLSIEAYESHALSAYPALGVYRQPASALIEEYEEYHMGLSQPIPLERGQLQLARLQYLDLSHNQLSGRCPLPPPQWRDWGWRGRERVALQYLDLSHNQLSGPIPPLGQLAGLQYLDLSHNQLSGSIMPARISLLSTKKYLDLSHNQLSGSIPPKLGRLTRLWKRMGWVTSKESRKWEVRVYYPVAGSPNTWKLEIKKGGVIWIMSRHTDEL